MTRRPPALRAAASALCAALLLSSWSPAAFAAAVAARPAASALRVPVVPRLVAAPAVIGTAAPLSGAALAPAISPAPAAPAAAASVPAPQALPAIVPAASAESSVPSESFGRAGAEDFAARVTGETLAGGAASVPEPVAAELGDKTARIVLSAPSALIGRSASVPREPSAPVRPEGDRRSVAFPLWLAGGAALLSGGLDLARWDVAAVVGLGFVIAFTGKAVAEAVEYAMAMWRGRGATEADLMAALRREVLKGGALTGNQAALVRAYKPAKADIDLTLAFVSRGLIWVRPELAATPRVLRRVLVHELTHMKTGGPRGPPRGILRGLLSHLASETRARFAELQGNGAFKKAEVSGLERALVQKRTSLRLTRPYEMLVLNPGSKELEAPELYAGLSGGSARLEVLKDADPLEALSGGRRYRAVVLGRAPALLPARGSAEDARLQAVLRQLDSLDALSTRLVARGQAFEGAIEEAAWDDLVDRVKRARVSPSPRAQETMRRAIGNEAAKLRRQIVGHRLKGVAALDLMERLYDGLQDRGSAFLSFGPDDAGAASWEKLTRYWESADGGQFRVSRVDMEDGGHLLLLRKIEPRAGFWLRPSRDGRIEASVENAWLTEQGRNSTRKALEDAGYGGQIDLFREMDVEVRHVFGADVGRQEIYVTAPRSSVAALRKYASGLGEVVHSESDFQTHLMDSADIQGVKPVWKFGVTGKDGVIFWIDTGADMTHEDFQGRLDVVDMVNEGTEDWLGHGTHVAGISISGSAGFLGMAKDALGIMAKVFSREQPGAIDGDIMAAASVAMKRGVDVINLSLGSRGSSADNLAQFFSQLTLQKNAKGEHVIVVASAGNSGPFDRMISQPAAGEDVIAVGSFAKSRDDGVPEYSFFSSPGFDLDSRFGIRRLRFKPDLVGIGGDVVTMLGSAAVYLFGVFSAKSKDSSASASDHADGKHTGMSGTSMSAPAVAGIALLVKLALRGAGALKPGSYAAENLPFIVKAILMRTAADAGIPVSRQGAGLVRAWSAVSLAVESSRSRNGWAWVERLKAVRDAEDRVYDESEAARSQALAELAKNAPEEPEEEPRTRSFAGSAAQSAAQKRFNEARELESQALIAALKDEVWLVRMRAAFAMMNLRSPSFAAPLAEAGISDPDARVRQTALLALGEIPAGAASAVLRSAADDPRWDVGIYAAYALARRGDRASIPRAAKELGNSDKSARFSAAWVLGQLGLGATSAEAESLSGRVRDRAERGNIRHLASASLMNVAEAMPEAISDRVVTDLLDAAGPENLALTRTIGRIFPAAVRSKAFVARLRAEPLKPIVADFVLKNRGAIGKPGALSELVQLLARAAGVPLDAPTAPMDPSGSGVLGVDAALGSVDVFVSARAGLPRIEAAMLARFEAASRGALPLAGGEWLSVPEHKLYALTLELERRGLAAVPALPYYPLSKAANLPAAEGGLTLDLRGGETAAEIPAGSDLSIVRVRADAEGVSELRVMAALEKIAAAAEGKGPVVVALTLAAPVSRATPLSTMIDRLVESGIGVVVGAGNGGPKAGSLASPAASRLAVVVAAVSAAGLQFYSARGTPRDPRVSWAEMVDDLHPGAAAPIAAVLGTGAAAELSAAKLAGLARVYAERAAAAGRTLPDDWFLVLTDLVRRAAAPLPGHAEHEVGAGLFDPASIALDALSGGVGDSER